jgi:aminoglycoside/choline kinase family phosphotransferase
VLRDVGAPIAPPLLGVEPTRERHTGLLVTLWLRLEHGDEDDADAADIGRSLQAVQDALALYPGELPSFREKLESARALLDDDAEMSALDPDNRRFLRSTFDALLEQLASNAYQARRLHGEPHSQNRLTTRHGVRWIDFEGACQGPAEWDLAFVPEGALPAFPPSEAGLLQLLRRLNSARTATLCWARYDVPALRWPARFHLQQLHKPVRGHS